MKKKSLSTLGYIMECLGIQTVSMSRSLHVDASLVSKWKTGDRNLSEKSIYFNNIVDYILEQSEKSSYEYLKNALMDLYPHKEITDNSHIESLLRKALVSTKSRETSKEQQILLEGAKVVPALIFEENSGRRTAITKLLDYAESMTVPGEIIFFDSEEFNWLLEDQKFSEQFTERIENLLQNGFHAKFVIHYSSYRERLIRLFNACSPLIFHRNVEWYYYEYYDETILNFSLFILNRAVSLLGLSAENANSTTMVFTDNSLVIRHEVLTNNVINQCKRLFNSFNPSQISEVVNNIYQFSRKNAFYSFLPAPAFMSVKEDLLKEILDNNDIDEENSQKCLELNNKLREVTSCYFSKKETSKEPFIHIFQLEEMIKRAKTRPFISGSLTLLGGKSVKILPQQYAQVLRDLAEGLTKHDNMQIVLVSEKDSISLPAMNFWCKQNIWMVQMDNEGFRLSDEIGIVNAASTALERCIKKVPPERKEKAAVRQYLLDLANEL